ncbi:unnamed protein product [Linum trigynum]|uniref:Uncharacterized protein n=1 Tax=Linum trigynum TaxID=586398 RepID=A0AAV2DRL2_9ROSI
MCGSSAGCRTFRCLIYLALMVSCVTFLVIVTVINLRYGPVARPLEIRIPPVAVELDLSNSTQPWLSFVNGSTIRFSNRKDHLNITIRRVEAIFMYRGIPVSCVLEDRPLRLRGRSEAAVEMEAVMCDRGGKFTHGGFPYTEDMLTDAREKGRMRMGFVMNVRAGYSHWPWAWEVLLRPECTEFYVRLGKSGKVSNSKNNIHDKDVFPGTGSVTCIITDPLWVR